MKTKKKKYAGQSHDSGGVRHVDLVCVTMQAVSKRRGTLHPVAFSTPSPCSPPPFLLHFLIFSHLLLAFSTPSLFSPSSTSTSSSLPLSHLFHLLFVFSTSSSSNPYPPRRTCLLVVKPVSSLSNPSPRCQTHLLVVEPVSSNPIEPTSGLVESALMSLPSGGLALVIAGLLESPSLAPTRRRWVGFAVVGLDLRLLASARCRRPTVVFDLAMRPLVLLLVSYLPLLPRRGVVSSSSSSSSSCRLSLFLFSLLLLRLMSSPSSFSSCPPLLLPVVSLGFPDGVVVRHRDPPSSSSSSRTSTLPPPHRELIPSLLVIGSR
jgi:hypothetical protein